MVLRKSKSILIGLGVLILISIVLAFTDNLQEKELRTQNIPKNGFVPDEATAIKVAEAIWLPVFGEKIFENKPFRANLKDSIWIVEGTLPIGFKGGTPYIEILKSNCKILKVTHGK